MGKRKHSQAEPKDRSAQRGCLRTEADLNVSDWFAPNNLCDAVLQGNVESVCAILRCSEDNDTLGHVRAAALFAAVEKGNVEVVQVLLSHGADVNKIDEDRHTALFAATEKGNAEIVQVLLSHGADVNKINGDGHTALFAAAEKGNVEVVQVLLSHGADVNKIDGDGHTALFAAAMSGNVEVVQVLLSHGADVNKSDWHGYTALFAAAKMGNVEVVQVLLSHGADVNKIDWHVKTALFAAAKMGNVEVVQVLLSHGADVNKIDGDGHTALVAAAMSGNVEVVQVLLSHGADVNKSDWHGYTALFAAAKMGNVEVVQVLLSHGADVNKSDEDGQTALFAAVVYGNVEVVGLLIDHGVNVQNALHLAVECPFQSVGTLKIIKLLLSYGASADVRNATTGETLWVHCLSCRPALISMELLSELMHSVIEICFILLERKVDVNARSCNGETTIHLIFLFLRYILTSIQSIHLNDNYHLTPDLVFNPYDTPEVQAIHAGLSKLLNLTFAILSDASCFKRIASSRDDVDGNTPLHIWGSLCYPTLLRNEDDDHCVIESILRSMAKILLDHGSLVNSMNGNGESPLHMAQTWFAVKFLITHGASPIATDSGGNTALFKHVKKKVEKQTIHKLYDDMEAATVSKQWKEVLDLGFDPWKGDNGGETILSTLLLQKDAFNVIQAFLEATGAPFSLKWPVDSNGDTPLHVICRDDGENSFWKLNLIELLVPPSTRIAFVNCLNRKGETALHIVCQRGKSDKFSNALIQTLLVYGAETKVGDGKDCCDLVEDNPVLSELLKQDLDLSKVLPWLPWCSKSQRYQPVLSKVARGHKAKRVDSLHFHNKHIGSGAFGLVFVGINGKDGREVAVKRLEKERIHVDRPEHQREVSNLVKLADCEHVVRYLSLHEDGDFLYIALELMEGNLEELLDNEEIQKEELVSLCRDLPRGLTFLHQRGIIHRDIKPSNILYKCNPKLCLKLADFGLSSKADNVGVESKSVMHSKAGTRCWMAPELLNGTKEHSKASDVFACGLVIHYLLSKKKHPFGSNEIDIVPNICSNRQVVDKDLSPEAKDLVTLMLKQEKDERPSAAQALRHPLFWSKDKQRRYLHAVTEIADVQDRSFKHALEVGFEFKNIPWNVAEIPSELFKEMNECRFYDPQSAMHLLKFMRNSFCHSAQHKRAHSRLVVKEFLFLKTFPSLFMNVYQVVKQHKMMKMEVVQAVLNSE